MRILHVSQGFPPFRVGGLTRYCTDLMNVQKDMGNEVFMLYPGHFSFGKTRIRRRIEAGFNAFEVINPLPMALVFGINAPERYTAKCNSACFDAFFDKNLFDVIHVHCTMGIYKEFFEAAKNHNVPMVFTTHDYYQFCPKCNLLCGETVCTGPSAEKCRECNAGFGLDHKTEIIMQSELYRKLKYSLLFTKLRSIRKGKMKGDQGQIEKHATSTVDAYNEYLDYHREIIHLFDCIHCNSRLTETVYKRIEPKLNYQVINISHANLPRRRRNKPTSNKFRILYMGGNSIHKGLVHIMEAVKQLDGLGLSNWELWLYGDSFDDLNIDDARIKIGGRYQSEQIESLLWNDVSLVVVPSICNETFGFVGLEALAAGVPAIVSDHVGCKDLFEDAPISMVFDSGDSERLAERIVDIKNNEYTVMKWLEQKTLGDIFEHAERITHLYEEI